MPIKLIAVDMDGTFLNSEKKYNSSRFFKQYKQLKQRGIHFVAASGNPLYTLKAYFPEIAHEMAFVAENGAYVVDGTETLNYDYFNSDVLQQILGDLKHDYAQNLILCGKDSAYIEKSVSEKTQQKLKIYFKNLRQVDDLSQIDDQICKVTLTTAQQDNQQILNDLEQKPYMREKLAKMVSSGFGFIDLIIPNRHKAYGLQLLQHKWGITHQDVLAIGDNYNDLEMIQMAGYGFAMQNAVPELKQVAKYIAPSNEHEGVLDVLDLVLNAQPFQIYSKEDVYLENI
ncbi:Cof-type HAD-IIB family hydrolase [Acinetobacter guerrae]|uniref:Cof-type HAD-IIB family hydrolase n=1 Tax=Acinetobacter guerrae TaxID=1843371 RepID=UPI00128C4A91|nr:Cof-type HAD-IIB family hydrolase [Acinetobacter guerrae]MPW44011.1 hydrolase [Acinetobacter guerrae]